MILKIYMYNQRFSLEILDGMAADRRDPVAAADSRNSPGAATTSFLMAVPPQVQPLTATRCGERAF